MNVKERAVLTSCRMYIIDNMHSVTPLLDDFIQAGIISTDTFEAITLKPTKLSQKQAFLNQLPTWGANAFHVFLKSLERNRYQFVTQHLQSQLENVTDTTMTHSEEVPPWISHLVGGTPVSERLLHLLAHELPPDALFVLGVVLGNSHARLQHYQAAHPHAVSLQLSQMLCDWRSSRGNQATVECLVTALRHSKVCEEELYRDLILNEMGVLSQTRGDLLHRMDSYASSATGNPEQWV